MIFLCLSRKSYLKYPSRAPDLTLRDAVTSGVYNSRRANRQYVAMTDEEIWSFLESKDRLFVAFPMRDSYPHLTPVWFCIVDKRIYLRTQDYKVKAKLAEYGKVCCSIDDGTEYKELRGVTIWGRSRVVTEEDLIQTVSGTINAKYKRVQWKESEMPRRWVAERKREHRAFIEIIPTRISSWDNRKLKKELQ